MSKPRINDQVNDARSQAMVPVIEAVCQKLDSLGWSCLYTDTGFTINESSPSGEFFHYDGEEVIISLSQSYLCRLDFLVVRSLAEARWERHLDIATRYAWIMKQVAADPMVVGRFQDALRSSTDFESIVASMADAPSKLVAIHLCNALSAHHVRYPMASLIDVYDHPATKDFADGTLPFSLIPLTSVYSSREHMKYAQALAWKVTTGNVRVSEDGTRRLVEALLSSTL